MATKKKLKEGVPYFVEWIDAYSPSDTGWKNQEDIEEMAGDDYKVWTCGWLQKQTPTMLIFASTVAVKHGHKSSIFAIPRAWIQRIEEVEFGPEE